MLRSLLVIVVALGALGQGSASATPGPTSPADVHPEWGSTTGHDAKLRKGCRSYVYEYAITPPDGEWSLETFLVGADGVTYGSGYFWIGGDPTAGQGAFRLCRRSTTSGRYTIRAQVSVEDADGDTQTGWLPDSTFRLRHRQR
jgi:hypothetical protein